MFAATGDLRQREDSIFPTSAQDQDIWEYKIIQSRTRAFKDSAALKDVCYQESLAGWELIEKFDDSRLRFRRPLACRGRDGTLSIDPYKTRYERSKISMETIVVALVIAVAITLLVIFALHG